MILKKKKKPGMGCGCAKEMQEGGNLGKMQKKNLMRRKNKMHKSMGTVTSTGARTIGPILKPSNKLKRRDK